MNTQLSPMFQQIINQHFGQFKSCCCGEPLDMEMERDAGSCVDCQRRHTTRIRYAKHYHHRANLAKYGIRRCEECEGEGWVMAGLHYWSQRPKDCPGCDGKGWNYEEAFGQTRHGKRQHIKGRMAA